MKEVTELANIAVYITGSIAAYKGIEVVRGLQKAGHTVRVGMTAAATKLVSADSLYALTHQPVITDLWSNHQSPVPHIELADWSDLAVVVPASADIIAKMANGIADDAVSTTLLATVAPKIVVPAMNNHMWSAPATQRNLTTLHHDGVTVMDPATGQLAEGYSGKGRLPEPAAIVAFVNQQLQPGEQPLAGRRVLITAGGTREPLDPVRFIGNRSSGKMGVALAEAAVQAGAEVDLIVGQISVDVPANDHIHVHHIQTTEELLAAVQDRFNQADVLIMAAAVADFKPVHLADQKIKKQVDQPELTVQLTKTVDILKTVAATKRADQLVIGFAAETNDLLANADKKLQSKHADWIVANRVAGANSAFANDQDQVTILRHDQRPDEWPLQSKQAVAQHIMQLISQHFGK